MMKRHYIILPVIFLCGMFACEKNDYIKYDGNQKTQILFRNDSASFIYGTLPDKEVDLAVPASVIGFVDTLRERALNAKVITDLSTAVEGQHFRFAEEPVVRKDSATAWICLDFVKNALTKGERYKLVLELEENQDFKPAMRRRCTVYFGDVEIPIPRWWDTGKLGDYNQDKYIVFMDFFRQAESKNSVIYQAIIDYWGENLDDGPKYGSLFGDYRFEGFWNKYVFPAMYDYCLANGDETCQIPNPNL